MPFFFRNKQTAAAPNEIDFLPREYCKRNFDRKDQRRQALIVGVLFLAMGVSYTVQRAMNHGLSSRLADAKRMHEVTLRQADELHATNRELDNLQADAAAITYLDHPWPQTQVIAAVVGRVPSTMTLTSMRVVRTPNVPLQRRRGDEEEPAGRTALARDESLLRERYDEAPFTLIISGMTSDHIELHQFILALDKHELVDRSELTSLDGVKETAADFEFTVTCSLTPGYGQPHGPAPATDSVASHVLESGGNSVAGTTTNRDKSAVIDSLISRTSAAQQQ